MVDRIMLNAAVAAGMFAIAMTASALQLSYSSNFGELVEGGWAYVHVRTDSAMPMECTWGSVATSRIDNEINVTVRAARPGSFAPCLVQKIWVGRVAAGPVRVRATIVALDGTPLDSKTDVIEVPVVADVGCREYPSLELTVRGDWPVVGDFYGTPAGMNAAQFVERHANDPEFHQLVGDLNVSHDGEGRVVIGVPALDANIPWIMTRLEPLFAPIAHLGNSLFRVDNACHGANAPQVQFIEHFDQDIGYFYASLTREIWARTGTAFDLTQAESCKWGETGAKPFYAFWNWDSGGAKDQFFTVDPVECRAAYRSGLWKNVDMSMLRVGKPDAGGACNQAQGSTTPSSIPLYRAWRPFGRTAHRYATDRAVIDAMVAQGWIDEGAVMCVLPPG